MIDHLRDRNSGRLLLILVHQATVPTSPPEAYIKDVSNEV